MNCWHCTKEIIIADKVMRTDSCPHCDRDMRVCKNCRFYARGVHNDCRETNAELIADKEHANLCDYFVPKGDAAPEKKTSINPNGLFSDGDKPKTKPGSLFK
ncbi:MAG: hypothetical protein AABZ39_17215 [Spirochaetota bacterium]